MPVSCSASRWVARRSFLSPGFGEAFEVQVCGGWDHDEEGFAPRIGLVEDDERLVDRFGRLAEQFGRVLGGVEGTLRVVDYRRVSHAHGVEDAHGVSLARGF
jgi:hypothetical protein